MQRRVALAGLVAGFIATGDGAAAQSVFSPIIDRPPPSRPILLWDGTYSFLSSLDSDARLYDLPHDEGLPAHKVDLARRIGLADYVTNGLALNLVGAPGAIGNSEHLTLSLRPDANRVVDLSVKW